MQFAVIIKNTEIHIINPVAFDKEHFQKLKLLHKIGASESFKNQQRFLVSYKQKEALKNLM
jgi:hypothetical protein